MNRKYSFEKARFDKKLVQTLWHVTFVLVSFAILILIRLPILANADIYLTSDEGFMASDMGDLYQGGTFIFYHENVSYQGVLHSLFAIPFFILFDVNSLAFKLPAELFYALYIWTSFLLARLIDDGLAWVFVLLLVICPPSILQLTTYTYPHILIGFFSNLAFLIFLENNENPKPAKVFLIFFIMGISFYTYSFSIIYFLSLCIIWALSAGFTFKKIWKILQPATSRESFARMIDFFLLIYFTGTLLSYIAGGIVLKTNNYQILTFFMYLDKPYFGGLNLKLLYPAPFLEFFLLAFLRIIFYRQDIKKLFDFIKTSTAFKFWSYGLAGFLIGLFPRWLGLAGKQVSGHAGFEVNIHPSNILNKIVDLIQIWVPRLFHLNFSGNLVPSIAMSALLLGSSIYFISNWIKNFRPDQPSLKEIVIFILLVLIASILFYQKPHTIRALFPLYVAVVFGTAFFLIKLREKSFVGFIFLITFWVSYYGHTTYVHYQDNGIINNFSIVEKDVPAHKIIAHLRKEKIPVAYTGYSAHTLNFLSGQNPVVNEFHENPLHGLSRKKKSESVEKFAVLVPQNKNRETYETYLKENGIACNRETLNDLLILSRCRGEASKVDRLRSLIKWMW